VTNNGDVTSVNTVVTDQLPDTLTFVSASTDRGSCSQGQVVVCSLGDIAPAENQEIHATILVTVQARPGTGGIVVINQATVSSNTRDYDGEDNVDNAYGKVQGESGCERECDPTATTSDDQLSAAGGPDTGVSDSAEGLFPDARRGALATTGADTDRVIALSTILLASGLGLMTVSRRRTQLIVAGLVPVPV
jgi:hypothetical protein